MIVWLCGGIEPRGGGKPRDKKQAERIKQLKKVIKITRGKKGH